MSMYTPQPNEYRSDNFQNNERNYQGNERNYQNNERNYQNSQAHSGRFP